MPLRLGVTGTLLQAAQLSAAPAGTVGVPYSYTFATTGFVGAITPSVVGGSLPAGLALSASGANIILSGTPTGPGTFSFTVHGVGAISGAADSAAQYVTISSSWSFDSTSATFDSTAFTFDAA